MAFYHHGTLRKYTGGILQYFNNLEVQHTISSGEVITKPVPIKYNSREKSRVLDELTSQQILEGNYNVLPRANLTFISLNKAEQRTTNKNNKINLFKSDTTVEYSFNSVPYEFLYDIVIQCRGMNESSQIIEQICSKFNPIVNLDIWDASNLSEPTRIPLLLQGIAIDPDEYEELSSNIISLTFSLSLIGNLYQPIKTTPLVKEFKMYLNEILDDEESTQKSMEEWDIDNDGLIE